jgi:fructose-bisphosphate aldolase class 1
MGARFAKWRAVIHASDTLPSPACVSANGNVLARYAALCQEQGLVPIVEPEVLMDGTHTIERCEEVTGRRFRRHNPTRRGADPTAWEERAFVGAHKDRVAIAVFGRWP